MPGGVPWCPRAEGRLAHVLSMAGSLAPYRGALPLALQCSDPSALARIPVLLVAHEGPVVAQDVHGVLPVPARAAVVLEAGLDVNKHQLSVLQAKITA